MKKKVSNTIYTIGHSTHSLEKFISMLQSFEVSMVADIRSLPGSGKYPHFNQELLSVSLEENHIHYKHLIGLGGRRRVKKDSRNTRWVKDAFRGYADYMETDDFADAIKELEKIASLQATAYMCAEAVWWRCHRSMVSDYLKLKGWTVLHIMDVGKVQEHSYTSPARIVNGKLTYSDKD